MEPAKASPGMISLEASLDEENRQVLAAIEKGTSRNPRPKIGRGTTPPPPIRSMLDIENSSPRRRSNSGAGMDTANTKDLRRSSARLNPADPSTWTAPHRTSSPHLNKITSESDTSLQDVPTIRIQPESEQVQEQAAKRESKREASKEKHHRRTSSELELPSKQSKATSPSSNSPSPNRGSPQGISNDVKRSLNKSSSFSDVSDTPDIIKTTENGEEEEAIVDDSDDQRGHLSSDGESPEAERGRTRATPHRKNETAKNTNDEEERGRLAPQSRGVRSLVDPVTSPSRPTQKSDDVHPPSSFGRSGPSLSDFEQDPMEADIQKAKNLGLNISPVDDSIADRHVRMIIRGEWAKLQAESDDDSRTSRLYLACSDLSTEASYALEWTIGTMLRDGDTLLAIYGIEDESAPKEVEGNSVVMAESAKAAHEASEIMESLTRQTTNQEHSSKLNSKFIPVTEASSLAKSVDSRTIGKKGLDRLKAMDEITQNFLKLVRKTPLQIRCMIEVIHCKSPKHLILNAIDELGPTLCVVGTRGRSSLKGVLLGSFSNYLVTKSSVPVMVARKRLKKPRHAKVNSTSIRLSNNLTNSILPRQRKSLEQARID